MQYRLLGNTGIKISGISLGSWMTYGQTVDDETTEACVKTAYEGGVNFFDGAEVYGSGSADIAVGKVLKKYQWPRQTYIVSGKCFRGGGREDLVGLSRKRLVDCCEKTLKAYGTDYLDLFFCHRPDKDTPLEVILESMNHLIRQGKILHWGTSEFSAEDLEKLWQLAKERGLEGPAMEQTGYNMLGRKRIDEDLLPIFNKYKIGSTVYSPLAGGLLTGKYNDEVPEKSRMGGDAADWLKNQLSEDKIQKSRQLGKIADELGCPQAHLALAWILKNPNVSTCITGSTKPKQIQANLHALDVVEKLDDSVLQQIEQILTA